MSTLIVRCKSGSKAISPLIASQLPSKARPIRRAFLSNTGLPELPPVMSLFERKQSYNSPSLLAYWPKSLLRIKLRISGCTQNSSLSGFSFSKIPFWVV